MQIFLLDILISPSYFCLKFSCHLQVYEIFSELFYQKILLSLFIILLVSACLVFTLRKTCITDGGDLIEASILTHLFILEKLKSINWAIKHVQNELSCHNRIRRVHLWSLLFRSETQLMSINSR